MSHSAFTPRTSSVAGWTGARGSFKRRLQVGRPCTAHALETIQTGLPVAAVRSTNAARERFVGSNGVEE